MSERLQKILSAAGVASRRLSEELIAQGRVSVNGKTVTALGTKADPSVDEIKVDGRRIKGEQRRRYILLYKPRGYITTRSDPQGRPTVMDLMRGVKEYVYPVGRLDYDSEGLLQELGHGTLWVTHGLQALSALEGARADFDLVFSDVVMPGMSGVELGREIQRRWPDLPVVLTSGYSHVLAEDGSHGFPLLQKPYSIEGLTRVLATAR